MDGHRIKWHGKGRELWARCECDGWVWLGTYELARGNARRAIVREKHAQHMECEREKHAEA